jgi:hypothetical protein
MRRMLALSFFLSASACGQASFEAAPAVCGQVFAIGCGAPGGLDGSSWNGANGDYVAGPGATVTSGGCDGLYCARIWAHGPLVSTPPPAGGPFPEPAPGDAVQLWIPIPPTASFVSFCWDFLNKENGPSFYNDGVSIDLVGAACGPATANLVYADTYTALSGASDQAACGNGGADAVTPGLQSFGPAFCNGAAFVRVTCWNGGDQANTSSAKIDHVCFDNPACAPLCALQYTAPSGAGSIAMINTPCPAAAGLAYLTVVKVGVGAYPSGWFFGVDMPFGEIVNEFVAGPPFTGTLSATGSSIFVLGTGVPSGLTITSVTTHWLPGYAAIAGLRPSVLYTTP